MRIALAQLNPLVGDLSGNTEKVLDAIERARREKADLVAFPELVVLGYPPKDLLLKPHVIRDNEQAVQRIAEQCRGLTALVGFAERNPDDTGRPLFNAVAVCRDGRLERTHRKTLLPTYDVFDECRYFEPGEPLCVEPVRDAAGQTWRIGLTICEDLWSDQALMGHRLYRRNPIEELREAGATIVVNASASPFVAGKDEFRRELFTSQATRFEAPVIFVNQVGGNDDLLFDGASAVYLPHRGVVARARAFEEDLLLIDFKQGTPSGRIENYPERIGSIYDALVMGTRDYVRKCGFREVLIGLSGGIDSALTAAIAADAVGAANVHGVALPSRYNLSESLEDARRLSEGLKIDFRATPIHEVHSAFEKQLMPIFGGRPPDVTEENLQARIRGNLLMALSNKFGWLLLTTGNKSEWAVGYCTLYGDMCGGLAVLSDVPKSDVYALARHVNERAGRPLIPQRTVERAPTAELRPNQTDQDTLPPYDVLDRILKAYVEDLKSMDEMMAEGLDAKMVADVIRLVDMSEYKRKQAPVGLKVTSRAFGTGRRMPIAARVGSV
jgi:NAD+ synthase (glutamine-hydrolysing)